MTVSYGTGHLPPFGTTWSRRMHFCAANSIGWSSIAAEGASSDNQLPTSADGLDTLLSKVYGPIDPYGWSPSQFCDETKLNRICRHCFEAGYQPILATLTHLDTCPIHGTPFTDSCFRCGTHLRHFSTHNRKICSRCDLRYPTFEQIIGNRLDLKIIQGSTDAYREFVRQVNERVRIPSLINFFPKTALDERFFNLSPAEWRLDPYLVPLVLELGFGDSLRALIKADRFKPEKVQLKKLDLQVKSKAAPASDEADFRSASRQASAAFKNVFNSLLEIGARHLPNCSADGRIPHRSRISKSGPEWWCIYCRSMRDFRISFWNHPSERLDNWSQYEFHPLRPQREVEWPPGVNFRPPPPYRTTICTRSGIRMTQKQSVELYGMALIEHFRAILQLYAFFAEYRESAELRQTPMFPNKLSTVLRQFRRHRIKPIFVLPQSRSEMAGVLARETGEDMLGQISRKIKVLREYCCGENLSEPRTELLCTEPGTYGATVDIWTGYVSSEPDNSIPENYFSNDLWPLL